MGEIYSKTSGVSTHEYFAVIISFQASVKQEIYHAFKFFTIFIYNFRFENNNMTVNDSEMCVRRKDKAWSIPHISVLR